MDKIKVNIMQNFEIIEIIKIEIDDILLELHFNLINEEKKHSFKIGISEDAETIVLDQSVEWENFSKRNYDAFKVSYAVAANDNNDLSRLIHQTIKEINLGMGKTLNNESVMYYFKLTTDKSDFLFFNNGDEGAYTFDKIDDILVNDTYGYNWLNITSSSE